jgi:hypothetical protein
MQFEHTHKQPWRHTLSFTIASQTIASSPDGSETSSAASSACGTPAATAKGGWRFRASSTVTSSSSPCTHTFGHSAALRPSGRAADSGSASLAARCPVCTKMAVNVNPYPEPRNPGGGIPLVCSEYP